VIEAMMMMMIAPAVLIGPSSAASPAVVGRRWLPEHPETVNTQMHDTSKSVGLLVRSVMVLTLPCLDLP